MICVFQKNGDNLICVNCSFSLLYTGEPVIRNCDFKTSKTATIIKNLGKEIVKQSTNTSKILAEPSLAEKRLAICEKCEYFRHKYCELCGCITPLKVKLEKSNCPIGKW